MDESTVLGASPQVSGIVLAGGQSRRLGTDKALLPLAGRPLIAHAIEKLAALSDDLIVVANTPQLYASLELPARLVADERPGEGALMGIYSGIRAARHRSALVVACDMPFLNLSLLRYMLPFSASHDVVIPRLQGMPEPVHAIYSKACLGPMARLLERGERQIIAFFPQVRIHYIEEAEIDRFDPRHLSFVNVNTPDDWDIAQRILDPSTGSSSLR